MKDPPRGQGVASLEKRKKNPAMFQGFVFVPPSVVLLYCVTVTQMLGHYFVRNRHESGHLK